MAEHSPHVSGRIEMHEKKVVIDIATDWTGLSAAILAVDSQVEASYHRPMSQLSESYRYIVRSPDVRSGNARVEGTRIAVHDVIGLLQNGETIETLTATCLPTLTRAQIYECLAYYEDHRGEVDLLVARQMAHEQP